MKNKAITVLFFFSGYAVLSYQVAWTRVLSQAIGVDAVSAAVSVAVILFGIGVGGAFGAALADRTPSAVGWFLVFECVMALFGCASDWILRSVADALSILFVASPSSVWGIAAESVLLGACLLPSTVLMGASLPLLTKAYKAAPWGEAVGRLQSANVFGAVTGVLVTGFYVLGTWGVQRTLLLTAAIQCTIALVAVLVLPPSELSHQSKTAPSRSIGAYWRGIAFGIGFISLAGQILSFRILGYYFSTTTYLVPMALGAYLTHLALGSAFSARLLQTRSPHFVAETAGVWFFLTSAFILLGPYILAQCGAPMSRLAVLGDSPLWIWGLAALLTLVFLLPVFFFSFLFPAVAQQVLGHDSHKNTRGLGELLLFQGLGNGVASFATVFLIPVVGTLGVFRGLMVLALALIVAIRGVAPWRTYIAPLFLFLGCILCAQSDFLKSFSQRGNPIVRVHEDLGGTFFVEENRDVYKFRYRLGAELITEQMRDDSSRTIFPLDVALAMGEPRPIRRILVIGLGPGDYPIFLSKLFPDAEIDIVELLASVPQEMREYGTPLAQEALQRSALHLLDGRRFLRTQRAARRGMYDFIQVGTLLAKASGCGNLYTREALTAVGDLLAPNGTAVIAGFAPAIRAALSVFPHVAIAGGSNRQRIDAILQKVPFSDDWLIRHAENTVKFGKQLAALGLRPFAGPRSYAITDRKQIDAIAARIPEQTDDRAVTEYFLNYSLPYETQDPKRRDPNGAQLWETDACTRIPLRSFRP